MNLQAINIPGILAQEIKELPENTVIISIQEEYGDLFKLKIPINEKILTVRFSDVHCGTDKEGKIHNPINIKIAREIVEFINKNKQSNFIIHCQAGIARSSAIAMYISLLYGHSLKENFWQVSNPNVSVLGMLFVATYLK